ncbi:hypothetical protein CMQ_4951 [Grosmannia clavigera kw1407]|uniref:Uncharacterized protein n=1 Tax=Grosmannia clavigera (strain kw1407 / UAMH 11150) TaxID=655863 RepID=F0XK14_GROCL|nr:uncharacterized protein CMQ_4951 [Grosmannia clavigera kw1407]EFX01880.1 hypothetical protein CMQ_4951 [Grosmannia clavigera kw1407]
MFTSKDKFLRRARGLRRSHIPSVNDDIPPVPPLPTDLPVSYPVTISMPMPMPPTAQPNSIHHGNHSQDFNRHVSTCSHFSQASSSWSSASSTASSSSLSSSLSRISDHHAWNPLRMHPPAVPASFFNDEGLSQPSDSSVRGFDFGFMAKPRPAGHAIRLVLDDDDDDDDDLYDYSRFSSHDDDDNMQFATMLSPPPHHRRLGASHSEADLHQPSRPATPITEAATISAPTSPVHLRIPFAETSDVDRFLKRGDWKRRGIVFGIQEA